MTEAAARERPEQFGPLPYPLVRRQRSPHVAIIMPVFNEAAVLELTYARVRDVMDSHGTSWSLLFVNDGSRDASNHLLESLFAADDRVSYITLSRNFGHQAALSAGLDHVQGDVIVTMDADLQHPPELIHVMVEAWCEGYDVVHTEKLATEELGPFRSITTRFAYAAIARVSTIPFVPNASDFRLLDREASALVRHLPERGRLYRGLTPWIGLRQAVVPYVAPARAAGSSTYGVKQLGSLFTRAFFDFSSAPLYVALILGLSAISLCFAYVTFVLIALLIGMSIPPGFVSLIFAIVFLSSVNLVLVGVLGIYVARIYDEVRGRPTYVVGQKRFHGGQSRAADDSRLELP